MAEIIQIKDGSTDVLPINDIVSATRIADNGVTTGSSGNIALSYSNDGYTAIIAPHCSGSDAYLRAWVSSSNGLWFLTAINPNTGVTLNNQALNIRYWVVKFKHS